MNLPSDERILKLNEQIYEALLLYVDIDRDFIRFDMPDKEHPPTDPTLCVFLYDVQEDLKLRHSQSGVARRSGPRYALIRCCYLLTYWDPLQTNASGPKSQTMIVMNQVLNALLNLELLLTDSSATADESEPAFTRVIEPSEHLSSLGNFWQSLGDKPRLCLNLAITVPVKLTSLDEEISPISKLELIAGPTDSPSQEQLPSRIKSMLIDHLKPATALVRAQLENLNIACNWTGAVTRDGHTEVQVSVDGKLEKSVYAHVVKNLADAHWSNNFPLGYKILFDHSGLTEGPAVSTVTAEAKSA